MENNITVKVSINGMITIHQGNSTMTIHPLDAWIHARLGIGKTQSYVAKTRENRNWSAFVSTREIVYWSSTGSFEQSDRRGNRLDLKKTSQIFFKDFEHRFPKSLSVAISKIAYLTNQTFCLGLLRTFAGSFCLCTTETTHSRDILLPNIFLSFLQFFQFYLILRIFYPTKSKLFFYFYIFWNHIWLIITLKSHLIF